MVDFIYRSSAILFPRPLTILRSLNPFISGTFDLLCPRSPVRCPGLKADFGSRVSTVSSRLRLSFSSVLTHQYRTRRHNGTNDPTATYEVSAERRRISGSSMPHHSSSTIFPLSESPRMRKSNNPQHCSDVAARGEWTVGDLDRQNLALWCPFSLPRACSPKFCPSTQHSSRCLRQQQRRC